MSAHDWKEVEEILHQAMTLAPEQRVQFLDGACGSDADLRAELNSLLMVGDDLSDGFLNSPLRGVLDREIGEIDSDSALAAGQIFAQRFELIRKLGEGGMGQVWLAEQVAPVRRQVALKLIKAGMYDEAVAQRFRSERQSLAMMDHPAIAKVFDAGTTSQGQPYLVMEYVPGLPITEYCDQHKLSIKDRLEIFIHACEGVQHAHQKAIIHRDLKPSNILVLEVDGKLVPRIIDFGLAKTTAPQVIGESLFTQLGQFIGTPGYMSPEQVNLGGRDIDTRTDVYTLGVVLYVLLTGLQPFETKRREKPSLEEWLRQLREEEPPNPSTKVSGDKDTSSATADARRTEPRQLISQLRGDLDWITMKALERDRARRYATPSELAADLRRYLNDEAVMARPASAGYQLRKFVRRHRVAATFLGMTTVLSVISSSAALVAVRQKHRAEFQAAQALQAQSRLLTQAAVQRLKDKDVAGAQGVILEVLRNSEFMQSHTPAAISAFQEIRAADVQLAVLTGDGDRLNSAAYSPEGTRIVTASDDKTARIWDARTGAKLAVLSGHGDVVASVAYSPDGSRIVTASFDKTARIWDARTGAKLAVLSGHAGFVYSAAYSPDGTRIVTASDDKTARIWDASTGDELAVLSGHGDIVASAAYSPDGSRIVTASRDKTAWIWDARIPATIAAQILWDAAAETDPLPDVDRTQLGLLPDARVRQWGAQGSACDHAASAVYDPDRLAPGASMDNIDVDIANSACSQETAKRDHAARADYQMGRTVFAKGDTNGARRLLEIAVNKGYPAARIDLADLMLKAPAKIADIGRVESLYEKAWQDGVSIAAFRLGALHESSMESAETTEAWRWYQKGADVGEPNSLARFAERDERNSRAEAGQSKRNALLLQSFIHYAAAATHAREEGWPDETWRNWRYRRATIARVLAEEGMMQQVADAYSTVLERRPPERTLWEQIRLNMHL
jgi:serine/threonine protein kinase